MCHNLGQILSEERFYGPGIVYSDPELSRIVYQFENLFFSRLFSGFLPVLTKSAAHIAAGIYAMGKNKRALSYSDLPERSRSQDRVKSGHRNLLSIFLQKTDYYSLSFLL